FIIHSVNDVMIKHFGKSLTSEGIHVLDPFTGTGTFIVRLMQSGLITHEDLVRKYTQELHANEIVLLSYYIAAINIEETLHSMLGEDYQPFEGIVLTDTFETTEKNNYFEDDLFGESNERLKKQTKESIFVIMGNPPYSIGKTNANDINSNKTYNKLNERIDETYSKLSSSSLRKSNYDSYIKAIRWASDRIGDKGIISFVTANGYIDKTSADGIRKSISDEFNHISIIKIRGAIKGRVGDE